MKNSYLLSGMIVLSGIIANVDAMEIERPTVYQMIDVLIHNLYSKPTDWSAIFVILDSMQGVIHVNEYHVNACCFETYGDTLLIRAIKEKKLLVAKILLEQYKANPNLPMKCGPKYTPLAEACMQNDLSMVKLLLQCGADPSSAKGRGSPTIVELFNQYKRICS